jgi:protein-S-isoprenylcysteine O-methyltransferase Ste14
VRLAGLWILAAGLFLAVLFVPAGRLDWWEGWVYFGVTMGASAVLVVVVWKRNPGLAEHRLRVGAGTKGWDAVLLALLKVTFLGAIVVAALDSGRHGWSVLPGWVVPVGAALLLLGIALFGWAMVVNAHFETTVRIQRDRDHRVVDRGPYAVVRHPGYAAFPFLACGTSLVLRSAWSLLPIALAIVVIVVRTALEDRLLRRELDGYAEYAGRVRFRLVPGVW